MDGAGKSELCRDLENFWKNKTGEYLSYFRQPGGTPTGEDIRRFIKEEFKTIDPYTKYMLMETCRVDMIRAIKRYRGHKESLGQFHYCISDRHIESSLVYQGMDGVNDAFMKDIQKVLYEGFDESTGLVPNVSFFLDVDPKIAVERINKRPGPREMYDTRDEEFFDKVRNRYLSIMTESPMDYTGSLSPSRYVYFHIDANGSVLDSAKQAIDFLERCL